jgi:hypothetical protein
MVDLLIAHPILDFILGIDGDCAMPVAFRTSCLVQPNPTIQAMAAEKPALASTALAFNIYDHISSPGCQSP